MNACLIKNVNIVNENKIIHGHLLIQDKKIKEIFFSVIPASLEGFANNVIDGNGNYLLPGIIDDQVHFREPGYTHKADFYTESRAAVAGGVTSVMEMPNTNPPATTNKLIEQKFNIASSKSFANYSFYLGASTNNLDELLKADPTLICGIKIFMGSSTGNLLVDNKPVLEKIFSKVKMLIAVHSEKESFIRKNLAFYKEKYHGNIPAKCHSLIRDSKECYESTKYAVSLANKHDTRLHILHLSTGKELQLFRNDISLIEKRITAEVCVHHLWFNDDDYDAYGNLIKCNPAIKSKIEQNALWKGLSNDYIDIIATDHAPHLLSEKKLPYPECPSGIPLIQHGLLMMLEHYHNKKITLEKIVEKMCHAPAQCFRIKNRGFIRNEYFADLVLLDLNNRWQVTGNNIYYKCGWTPLLNHWFRSKVIMTVINGNIVFENDRFYERIKGEPLRFDG